MSVQTHSTSESRGTIEYMDDGSSLVNSLDDLEEVSDQLKVQSTEPYELELTTAWPHNKSLCIKVESNDVSHHTSFKRQLGKCTIHEGLTRGTVASIQFPSTPELWMETFRALTLWSLYQSTPLSLYNKDDGTVVDFLVSIGQK